MSYNKPQRRHFRSAFVLLVLPVLWITGCQSKQPTPAPALTEALSAFPGTPLSGPLPETTPDFEPTDLMRIDVRWIALQRDLPDVLAPVDAQSRLIVAPLSGTALLSSGELTRLVRFGEGNSAWELLDRVNEGAYGPAVEITRNSHMLAPGTTTRFELRTDDQPGLQRGVGLALGAMAGSATTQPAAPTTAPAEGDGAPIEGDDAPAEGEMAELPATRPTRSFAGMLAITISDRPPAPPPQEEDAPPPLARPPVVRETAVVDSLPLKDGATQVVVVPFKMDGTPWTTLLAVITVHELDDDTALEVAEVFRGELQDVSERVRFVSPPGSADQGSTIAGALNALDEGKSHRPPLLVLATVSDAAIAADVVLVADDTVLAELRQRVREFASPENPPELLDLQWFLDRTALQLLCQRAEEQKLSSELQSVMLLHTGDLARRPDALMDLLRSVRSSEELQQRLVAENFVALEDSAPAVRVTAFDWLRSRQRAPAGFDPLADARSRRAAIDQAVSDAGVNNE